MQLSDTSQSRKQQWLSVLLYGLLLWIITVCGTLFYASHAVRRLPTGGETVIGIGPLDIVRIAKEAGAGGSFTLSLAFRGGIWVLGILCLGVQIAIAIGGPLIVEYVYRKRSVHNRGK